MNAQSKHTPGPWTLSTPPVCAARCRYIEIETEILAEIRDTSNGVFVDVANATLIAAAPELLEALKHAVECMESVADGIIIEKRYKGVSPATHVRHMAGHLAQHAKIVKAAIAKAEGRA